MNGEVSLTVTTSQVRFELKFDRNISVIQGDSGTGKSLICTLLNESQLPNSGISVKINKDIPVVVMPDITLNSPVAHPWYEIIKNSSDTLFFIDETCDCLTGKPFGFAQCIKSTSNYYVIISRKRYPDLPYSIHSLYTLNKETMELKPAIIRNIHCLTKENTDYLRELLFKFIFQGLCSRNNSEDMHTQLFDDN